MLEGRVSFLRQSLIIESMMSAIIIVEVQVGVHTGQVDLGPEISETFNDVAGLKCPKQPSLEKSKLHPVCYTFSRKRLAWPDEVYQSS